MLVLWFAQVSAAAAREELEFSLHKMAADKEGETILVIGGIQGDEPGGFNAASLLVTHYDLQRGNLWVVPNLNFESIVKRSRGVHGDMNRKFPSVSKDDPDYARVEKIKHIIQDAEVDFIVNLHDGSGFYRETREGKDHNPDKWGQSIIIDQEVIESSKYRNVGSMARSIVEKVNQRLDNQEHVFRVKNTLTRDGNVEMAKTLTYFAINQGKSAVGLEASKALSTEMRVYYHLLLVEEFMARLGIEFERRFDLTPKSVKRTVDNNIQVSFYGNKVMLDMAQARRRLGYVPLKKNAALEFRASSPLVAITNAGQGLRVSYGNRRVTELQLQRFEYDASRGGINMQLDDAWTGVDYGTIVEVNEAFVVEPMPGYRVNIIGWLREGVSDEAGMVIRKKDIRERFSVDRHGTTFRVEVYIGDKFSGMVLVRYVEHTVKSGRTSQDGVS